MALGADTGNCLSTCASNDLDSSLSFLSLAITRQAASCYRWKLNYITPILKVKNTITKLILILWFRYLIINKVKWRIKLNLGIFYLILEWQPTKLRNRHGSLGHRQIHWSTFQPNSYLNFIANSQNMTTSQTLPRTSNIHTYKPNY